MVSEETYNYLTERIGKITNALYKVTDFLSDKEPLKWSLRSASVRILINIVSLKDKNSQEKIISFAEIFEALNQVIYMLDLVGAGGFIAGLNFEILKREYEKIGEIIENNKREEILFSDKLFPELSDSVHKTHPSSNGHLNIDKGQGLYKGQLGKGQYQNMSIMNNDSRIKKVYNKQQLNNDRINLIKNNKKNLIDNQKDTQSREIIDFVKKNGHVTIKDISSHFPKMSQKTIQRRLLHVVDIGLLEKEGDKRWRRYFVKV